MYRFVTAVTIVLLIGCGQQPAESTAGSTSTIPSTTDTSATSTTGTTPAGKDPTGTQYGGTSATDTSSTAGRQDTHSTATAP